MNWKSVRVEKRLLLLLFVLMVFHSIMQVGAKSNGKGEVFGSGDIRFAVIGDYGKAGPAEEDVANLIKNWNPDLIITLGDNNYDVGSTNTIDANIGQYYHEFIYPYIGSYGAGAITNRFFPALGNHDWYTSGATPYLDYFTLPDNERYYDFVSGAAHFFVLDSDPNEPDGITNASTQALWLQNALAASTSEWKIVYMHHAPYSSGLHGSNATMQWPFAAWGADVVLAGHDHTYERLLIDGLPYFVNGLGGRSLYAFAETPVIGSQVRYNADYGAMLVDLDNMQMTLQFITRTGIVVDTYTLHSFPLVASVLRADANPTTAAQLVFQVTFSETVTNVDYTDFMLTIAGNVSGAGISGISGSDDVYLVTVDTGSGDGTIRLDVVDDDSILDADGHPLGGLGIENGSYSAGEFYAISPSNDDFSFAEIISAFGPVTGITTLGATVTDDDPAVDACGLGKGIATVWYTYISGTDSAISVDTYAADFDTFIAVWTGIRGNLQPVACNDDANGTKQSAVAFQVEKDTTYYIEIGQP